MNSKKRNFTEYNETAMAQTFVKEDAQQIYEDNLKRIGFDAEKFRKANDKSVDVSVNGKGDLCRLTVGIKNLDSMSSFDSDEDDEISSMRLNDSRPRVRSIMERPSVGAASAASLNMCDITTITNGNVDEKLPDKLMDDDDEKLLDAILSLDLDS